jgi:hypothetical protein
VKHPVKDEYGNKRENDDITWIKVKYPVQDEYGNRRENYDITWI